LFVAKIRQETCNFVANAKIGALKDGTDILTDREKDIIIDVIKGVDK